MNNQPVSASEAEAALIEEMSSELEDDDILCLYEFSWFLNQYRPTLDDEAIARICQSSYAHLSSRFRTKLVWVTWPKIDPEDASDASPDTVPDFEISATGDLKSPLLALMRLD